MPCGTRGRHQWPIWSGYGSKLRGTGFESWPITQKFMNTSVYVPLDTIKSRFDTYLPCLTEPLGHTNLFNFFTDFFQHWDCQVAGKKKKSDKEVFNF